MDLPTCPSCGQSVLDDDAIDCPFCGASMDGSSGGAAPKSPAARKREKARPNKSDDEDPFAIERAPAARKVIPCARKPMKGRTHRIICPMCDAQGFIPRGAMGKQVKCANKDCLVPVFTAGEGQEDTQARAPGRVSDDAVAAEVKVSTNGEKKNPLVMYSVAGIVAVAATFGLVTYLNNQGETELPPIAPVTDINSGNSNDLSTDSFEPEERPVAIPDKPEDAPPEYRKTATELVTKMISQSRVTSGNRDKAYCRRLTGDAYLRLGMAEEAAAEFKQMDKLSSDAGRSTRYYKIGPLLSEYWRLVSAGESDAATNVLNEASELRKVMPSSGNTALESGIGLAAAVAHRGNIELAAAIIEYQQVDRTVVSQVDLLQLAAWASATATREELGHKHRTSPFEVFSWNDPLVVVVAAELAARSEWQAAIDWASAVKDQRTAGDCFASIAADMSRQNDMTLADKLVEAATARNKVVLLRTNATLGRTSAEHRATAQETLPSLDIPPLAEIPKAEDLVNVRSPDFRDSLLKADAIADIIIAAIANGDTEEAATAFDQLFEVASSTVPPTNVVRGVAAEVALKDGEVKQRIARELRLKSSEVRTNFLAYRRGVDRLQKASERRHLELNSILGRIVDAGGLESLKLKLADSEVWRAEVFVDDLRGLLFAAAAARGQEFPEILVGSPELQVNLYRANAADAQAVINPMIAAWRGYLAGRFAPARPLESPERLPGLCVACLRFIARGLGGRDVPPGDLVEEVILVKNGVYREQCLAAILRAATQRGEMDTSIGAVNKSVKLPTQKVVSLHSIVLGALALEGQSE